MKIELTNMEIELIWDITRFTHRPSYHSAHEIWLFNDNDFKASILRALSLHQLTGSMNRPYRVQGGVTTRGLHEDHSLSR
jgi:hypothetical protein